MDVVHQYDVGTQFYINVIEDDAPLDTILATFTVRQVRVQPIGGDWHTILDVPVVVDSLDNVMKLMITSGPQADFELDVPGRWLAEVTVGDSGHMWTSAPLILCYAHPVMP